jgi:predicted ATPase
LVYKKTQGNPFFVNQLLVKLHKDGHISPVEGKEVAWDATIDAEDTEEGGWVCNMGAIQEANYTSNVVDLMIASLQALDVEAQKMLGMAATIGNQFDLTLLARLCDMLELTVSIALRAAVRYL